MIQESSLRLRGRSRFTSLLVHGMAAFFCVSFLSSSAQTASAPPNSGKPNSKPTTTKPHTPSSASDASQQTRITPDQAKQLFSSVDAILKFDSDATGLPVLHSVHRQLVTRDEVEHYLLHQLHDDRDAKRLERSELVLKKFGLLDRDFELQPFLIKLLREQIAGYYDDKTKTVNLLDWIPPADQKPVLAHELTHALQDQHVNLRKWDQDSDQGIAKNVQQDNRHIATDEQDTARDAVVEGQAMAVFLDYALAPSGKNILTAPQVVDKMNRAMADSTDSPTLSNAPLLLQKSLIFPYVAGLNFVRTVLAAKGKRAAFAGMLDRPPSSSFEIMTPKAYLDHATVPVLHMPDIHTLIDSQYRPYDIGVMGEFDVQVLAELFGGGQAAQALTPAWRGGIYYTAQSKSAKPGGDQDSPASLALLYLSRWATPQAAQAFADIYAQEVPRKYDHATLAPESDSEPAEMTPRSRIWNTPEGPVLIVTAGRTVYISESFPLDLARKLQFVMMGSIENTAGSMVADTGGSPTDLTDALRHWLFAELMPPTLRAIPKSSGSASKSLMFPGALGRLQRYPRYTEPFAGSTD